MRRTITELDSYPALLAAEDRVAELRGEITELEDGKDGAQTVGEANRSGRKLSDATVELAKVLHGELGPIRYRIANQLLPAATDEHCVGRSWTENAAQIATLTLSGTVREERAISVARQLHLLDQALKDPDTCQIFLSDGDPIYPTEPWHTFSGSMLRTTQRGIRFSFSSGKYGTTEAHPMVLPSVEVGVYGISVDFRAHTDVAVVTPHLDPAFRTVAKVDSGFSLPALREPTYDLELDDDASFVIGQSEFEGFRDSGVRSGTRTLFLAGKVGEFTTDLVNDLSDLEKEQLASCLVEIVDEQSRCGTETLPEAPVAIGPASLKAVGGSRLSALQQSPFVLGKLCEVAGLTAVDLRTRVEALHREQRKDITSRRLPAEAARLWLELDMADNGGLSGIIGDIRAGKLGVK